MEADEGGKPEKPGYDTVMVLSPTPITIGI
jgi:hypothetical protein